MEIRDLKELACDTYFGRSQYSEKESNDIIINMIFEVVEPLPARKDKYKHWMKRNADAMFEIIEEVVTAVHNEITLDAFGGLVEVETFDIGDKKEFIVENPDLFDVALKATGVKTVARQRIYDRKVPTEAFALGVKIYAEMFDFLTGKINWTNFVDKVAKSFDRKIATLATATMFGAYDGLAADFKHEVNAAGLGEKLRDIIVKVADNTGYDVQIVGTRQAIAKIENVGVLVADDVADRRNFGYVKVFEGTPIVELPNYYDKEVKAFDVPTDMLLILPNDGKGLVKLGYEGSLTVEETTEGRKDFQLEMEMERMIHLGVAIANTYGMIKIQ